MVVLLTDCEPPDLLTEQLDDRGTRKGTSGISLETQTVGRRHRVRVHDSDRTDVLFEGVVPKVPDGTDGRPWVPT
jgi:hypothetical protein